VCVRLLLQSTLVVLYSAYLTCCVSFGEMNLGLDFYWVFLRGWRPGSGVRHAAAAELSSAEMPELLCFL